MGKGEARAVCRYGQGDYNDENADSLKQVFYDQAIAEESVAQRIMNIYEVGLGDYDTRGDSGWNRWNVPRERALRASDLANSYVDLQEKLKPDAPYIGADGLHPWVWAAAQPMWEAGAPRSSEHGLSRGKCTNSTEGWASRHQRIRSGYAGLRSSRRRMG
jgi:hypothetical protein